MPNMQDVLRSMFDGSEEQEEISRPHPLAQVMELKNRWDAMTADTPSSLKAGDIVWEKKGLGLMRLREPALLVRMIDPDSYLDKMLIRDAIKRLSMNQINCIIAVLSDNGGGLMFYPHDIARLELYPTDKELSD